MAFYIKIIKIKIIDEKVRYSFEADNGRKGEFDISSRDGSVELISAMDGDVKEHYFKRAAAKIYKEWKKGVLPELSEWAS